MYETVERNGAGIRTVFSLTWTMKSGFLQDGGNVCALAFVLTSGVRIVSKYEGLCAEILEFCRDKSANISFTAVVNVEIVEKNHGSVDISACADHEKKLVDRYGQLSSDLRSGYFPK